MSLSTVAVELCALLVNETYGELTSRIFTILLRRGRLPIPLLAKHTRLTPRQIRHGLAVLIQQNLVYHSPDPETAITHYEANHDAAYGLVRSGKILDVIETRYGEAAKDVVQNLFLLGHTKVGDLAEAYESKLKQQQNGKGKSKVNGANGHNEHSVTSTGQLHSILGQLLTDGYLEPVVEIMFRSPSDLYNKTEQEVLRDNFGGATKGIKQKVELKVKIRERIQRMRDQRKWVSKSKKRPLNGNGMNGSNKRLKLSNGDGAANGGHFYEEDGEIIDPDLVIRINYEKCTVALRTQRLTELARDRIGETTSQVYSELLRLLEDKIPRCRLDPRVDDIDEDRQPPTVSTMEVANSLDKSIVISGGIGKVKGKQLRSPKRNKRNSRGDLKAEESMDESDEDTVMGNGQNGTTNGHDEDDPFDEDIAPKRTRVTFQASLPSEDRENRMLQVKNHLMLLANDECCFLRHCGIRGLGEWTVDFGGIVKFMQETELDAMVLENFGQSGHRLTRMLRKLGKLDEKMLPTLALLKQKDIRTKLAEMQMAGVVEIQEVCRDNSHANNRTTFLWYFNTERTSTILLNSYYKSMSRCIQRLGVEKRQAREAIAPTERSDMYRMAPEEYLEPPQLRDLYKIMAKEEALLGQIGRLDDLVGTFRDF